MRQLSCCLAIPQKTLHTPLSGSPNPDRPDRDLRRNTINETLLSRQRYIDGAESRDAARHVSTIDAPIMRRFDVDATVVIFLLMSPHAKTRFFACFSIKSKESACFSKESAFFGKFFLSTFASSKILIFFHFFNG